MPSEDFTGYTADFNEVVSRYKTYAVHIEVTNAAGDCDVTKTNTVDLEDVVETTDNIDSMGLRENLLQAP